MAVVTVLTASAPHYSDSVHSWHWLVIIFISYFFVPFLCSETKVEWCLNFKTLKALTSVVASHLLSQPVSLL